MWKNLPLERAADLLEQPEICQHSFVTLQKESSTLLLVCNPRTDTLLPVLLKVFVSVLFIERISRRETMAKCSWLGFERREMGTGACVLPTDCYQTPTKAELAQETASP